MTKNNKPTHYWFRAKRYVWGWGLPLTWQGWVIYIAYAGFIIAGTYFFPPEKKMAIFIFFVVIFSLILIMVCWLKGEPTRWRWGNDKGIK